MAKKVDLKKPAGKKPAGGGRVSSRTAAAPQSATSEASAPVIDAPVIDAPAPVPALTPAPAPDPVASPFVDDGGVIGMSHYPTAGPDLAAPQPSAPEVVAAVPQLASLGGGEASPAGAAPAPASLPAPELVLVATPAAPAASTSTVPADLATPVIPIAPEMEMPPSAEDMLFASLNAAGGDEQEPGEEEGKAAGDFGGSASAKIASGTTDFVLKTFGKLSNEFILDLTTINEDELREAVLDEQMPKHVLKDAEAINANNRKNKPFTNEYREMLREPLRKVLEVSGVENLSPVTMLLVVLVTVVFMMYMDTRKRMADNDKFMRLVFKRYGKPAEVVTGAQEAEAAPAA